MPEELNVEALVTRQESPSTLVRFEDETDANAPRLNYAVALPGAFSCKLFIETDYLNDELPWTDAAREDQRKSPGINDLVDRIIAGETPSLPPIDNIAILPTADAPRRSPEPARFVQLQLESGGLGVEPVQPPPEVPPGESPVLVTRAPERRPITSLVTPSDRSNEALLASLAIDFDGLEVSMEQVAAEARQLRAPVFYRTFGGTPRIAFVQEGGGPEEANPRFIIIEHYRLSSYFGDYGAGKTVGVFSLMPGEETTLYIRNWRRSKTTIKQASSIFDSHTEEAATEFESDILSETTDTASAAESEKLSAKYSQSGGVNLGVLKHSHSIGFSGETTMQSARESVSKNVAKVTTHHASKASSKRETEVTQEIEQTDAEEFETITERKIKNTNLSRTLNIVTRELNQEFTTYFALIDVSLAFVNDLGVFEVFHIHEIDRMLSKYLPEPAEEPGEAGAPSGPFGGIPPYDYIRARLIEQINAVFDFRGTRHEFLEEVAFDGEGEEVFPVGGAPPAAQTYLRVRRPRRPDQANPFYEPGFVPVEGVVMNQTRNTVRTPAVIIDALLGHGVALDNYSLGMQQETLREKQLENRKVEVALDLIAAGDTEALEAYRQIFGSVDAELLREVAVGSSD